MECKRRGGHEHRHKTWMSDRNCAPVVFIWNLFGSSMGRCDMCCPLLDELTLLPYGRLSFLNLRVNEATVNLEALLNPPKFKKKM
jgi:hypothetical protein